MVDLATKIIFLGTDIDSIDMCLRLPGAKLLQVWQELAFFKTCERASKQQLQSLAGKLSFYTSVIYCGTVYSRRIIDTINRLKADNHKIKLIGGINADIVLWEAFMAVFNGKSLFVDKHPVISIFTASGKHAAGVFSFFFFFFFFSFFDDDWFYSNWEHTNSKEILAIYLEVCRWSSYWQNRRIYIQSNNMTTKTTIHRVTSGNPFLMACLRHLFWLSEGTVKCIRPCIQSVTFSASLNVAMQQTTCSDLSIEILFFTYPIPGMFYYLGL